MEVAVAGEEAEGNERVNGTDIIDQARSHVILVDTHGEESAQRAAISHAHVDTKRAIVLCSRFPSYRQQVLQYTDGRRSRPGATNQRVISRSILESKQNAKVKIYDVLSRSSGRLHLTQRWDTKLE